MDLCVRENPDILYYSGCTYSSNGLLTLQYRKSQEEVKNHTALLKEKVEALTRQLILPEMTDYEKELIIHNYIVENCDYDIAGYKNALIPSESYSAYGVLCLGTAVCEGYAEAAKLLLNRAGVICDIITGTSKGEGHAWNLVKIGGAYYQLDITWDDPIMADGSKVLNHHYFNVTDDEMSIDHEWDKKNTMPCEATEFNYYVYNKWVVYDEQEFINLVVELVESGSNEISVKIMDAKSIGFDYKQAIKNVCDILKRGCISRTNEDLGVVDMTFI